MAFAPYSVSCPLSATTSSAITTSPKDGIPYGLIYGIWSVPIAFGIFTVIYNKIVDQRIIAGSV